MSSDEHYTPFSQRNGFAPIPPQLELGVVSDQQRSLLNYAIDREIDRSRLRRASSLVDDRFASLAKDVLVKCLGARPAIFSREAAYLKTVFEAAISGRDIGDLYDLIEFIIRHPVCSTSLMEEITNVLIQTRAAYRVVEQQIVAIGTEQLGAAVERAFTDTAVVGANASRTHLISAGAELRQGNWSNSVRESIHAVEAMARRLNPNAKTLSEALKTIERSVHIHGSLKEGFNKLYGYTNDEDGIRHALSEEAANVDEVDALFMLGACASFVSYLIARENSLPSS